MDVVIVGAGAVGSVIGARLHAAGHRVWFWVRPAQRARSGTLAIERVGGARTGVQSPARLCEGDVVPASDWVLICVRGEQVEAALRDVAQSMGAARRVAVAAVSLQRVTPTARRAGLTGPVYALHVSFGSHAVSESPRVYRYAPFALPTMLTPEGDRANLREARALARALRAAGLPARAALDRTAPMRLLSALISVLALGWDLCGWDLRRLTRSRALRRETARALHEAAGLVLPGPVWLRSVLPVLVFELGLRLLPLGMGREGQELWRHHGPKIRAQTESITAELLAQASARARPAPALRALFDRHQASIRAAPRCMEA